jgi:hypothetical protein
MEMALPTYNPSYRDMPTYTAPRWDEGKIDALTQKRAAPGLRAMRQQVGRASGVSYDNPNMKRMTLRDALQGYGQGVEQTLSGANAAATNEYGNQFSAESAGSQAEFNSQANAVNSYNANESDRAGKNFQAGMADWEMATQNKYAQSARGYLNAEQEEASTTAFGRQKELMAYQKSLSGDDEWEAKLAAQMGYEKEMMRYSQDYEKDDWEAKMQKQYDLQQKAADEAFNRRRLMAGGNSTEWKPTNWNTNEGRAYNDAMTKRAAELRKARGY